MREPDPDPASMQTNILEKLEMIRKGETAALCESLLKAMADTKSVSAIQVGPELPDFHKLASDDDITCYLATFERMATAAKK